MVDAAAGNQQDLLVVESGEGTFQGRRGEDTLVAGLEEGVALGVDGLQSEFTDLVAREGTLNLLLAHVDGAVTIVVRLSRGSSIRGGGGLEIVIRAIGAQPIAGGRELGGRVLQDVGEDAVGRSGNASTRSFILNGDRVTDA